MEMKLQINQKNEIDFAAEFLNISVNSTRILNLLETLVYSRSDINIIEK